MCSSPVVYEECSHAVNARAAEESLVAAAIQGDVAAFETLALRYKRLVMAITRRVNGSLVEAEDLTQQAFLKAFANVSRFAGRCSFSTWLTSIAMNEARMWLRKARKSRETMMTNRRTEDSLDALPDFMDWRHGPEAAYSKTERNRVVYSGLERPKPAMRVALQLCDLEGQSTVEASLALGITVSAIKSWRLRGRVILCKRLEARFTPAKRHRPGEWYAVDEAPRSPKSR